MGRWPGNLKGREKEKGDWGEKRKNIEREKLERGEKSVEFNQSGDRTSRDRAGIRAPEGVTAHLTPSVNGASSL